METPKEENGIVFEPYESEEDVLNDGLSFEGEFEKEKIGWSKQTVTILIVVAAAVLLVLAALLLFLPRSRGAVVFSEAMSANDTAYVHPQYGSVDWVELYNPTDKDVDLSGFGLTDELKKQYKYRFPEGSVLKSGEYLVLWCTGGTTASDADPYCTGFALSQEGETLFLIDPGCLEIAELTLPALETDFSYARTATGEYRTTATVTPGAANRFSD